MAPTDDSDLRERWTARFQSFFYGYVVPDFAEHRLTNVRTGAPEVVVYDERRHVIALLNTTWVAVMVASFALPATLAAESTAVQLVLAVVCVVAELYVLFKFVDWFVTRFYVTDYRLLELAGFLDLRLNEIPKTKLTDIQLRQSLLGRFLGYGTIRVETAGQEQALGVIEFVRQPSVLTRYLSSYSLT